VASQDLERNACWYFPSALLQTLRKGYHYVSWRDIYFERFSGRHEQDKALVEHSPEVHQGGTDDDSMAGAREVGKTIWG